MKIKRIIMVVGIITSCLITGCTANERTRNYGGSMTVNLPANEKLLEVTWKDDDLYYLTRPMRSDEKPETYKFREKSSYGVLEGTVTLIESRD